MTVKFVMNSFSNSISCRHRAVKAADYKYTQTGATALVSTSFYVFEMLCQTNQHVLNWTQ